MVDVPWPVGESQTVTVISSDADTSRLPSVDQAINVARPVCPSRIYVHSPVAGFQILTVLSTEADASLLPSGDQTIDLIQSLSPARIHAH